MRRTLIALVALSLAACGTDPTVDGPDAVAGPATTIDVRPLCQEATVLFRFADGTQTRSTRKYALLANVAPGAVFLLQRCGLHVQPPPTTCVPGATCIGSSDVPGARCYDTYRVGEFVDGKLLVECGSHADYFTAAGGPAGSSDTGYDSIKVMVY